MVPTSPAVPVMPAPVAAAPAVPAAPVAMQPLQVADAIMSAGTLDEAIAQSTAIVAAPTVDTPIATTADEDMATGLGDLAKLMGVELNGTESAISQAGAVGLPARSIDAAGSLGAGPLSNPAAQGNAGSVEPNALGQLGESEPGNTAPAASAVAPASVWTSTNGDG